MTKPPSPEHPRAVLGIPLPPDQQERVSEPRADEAVEVIPVLEERMIVSKRLIEREGVRVRLFTDEVAELARVSLPSERLEIERVPVGREVEQAPPVREEDGVTVIPVLEEIVVVDVNRQ